MYSFILYSFLFCLAVGYHLVCRWQTMKESSQTIRGCLIGLQETWKLNTLYHYSHLIPVTDMACSTTSATMWLGHGSKSKHQEFCNSALCGQITYLCVQWFSWNSSCYHSVTDVPDLALHSGMLCFKVMILRHSYRLIVAMVCCGYTEIGQKYSYMLKFDKSILKVGIKVLLHALCVNNLTITLFVTHTWNSWLWALVCTSHFYVTFTRLILGISCPQSGKPLSDISTL